MKPSRLANAAWLLLALLMGALATATGFVSIIVSGHPVLAVYLLLLCVSMYASSFAALHRAEEYL